MAHSYEEGKSVAMRGLYLLGVVTIVEVLIALLGNGHLIEGVHLPRFIMYPVMIGLSLYKAYFIVYFFMHMAYEVSDLRLSVLLPTLLLIWAMIAFFMEGHYWGERRAEMDPEYEEVFEKKAGGVEEGESMILLEEVTWHELS